MTVPHVIDVTYAEIGGGKGKGSETGSERENESEKENGSERENGSESVSVTERMRWPWLNDVDCGSSAAVPESPQAVSQPVLSETPAEGGAGVVSMVIEWGVVLEVVPGLACPGRVACASAV